MNCQPRASPWEFGWMKIRPERAKALFTNAFALSGRGWFNAYTQGVALGLELMPFQGTLRWTRHIAMNMRNLNKTLLKSGTGLRKK